MQIPPNSSNRKEEEFFDIMEECDFAEFEENEDLEIYEEYEYCE